MEIDHVQAQKNCFICKKIGHMVNHSQLRFIIAAQSVTPSEITDVHCSVKKKDIIKGNVCISPTSTKKWVIISAVL